MILQIRTLRPGFGGSLGLGMLDDFLPLTTSASLLLDAHGDVLLTADGTAYWPWSYIPDELAQRAGQPTPPSGTSAKTFVAACMNDKHGPDLAKWDTLALKFLNQL